MDESTQIALEAEVARLERRVAQLSSVFQQATRELAVLEGVGGFWARLTGQHEARVAAATEAAHAARAALDEDRVALEIAHQALGEERRKAREHRETEEGQAALAAIGDENDPRHARFAVLEDDSPAAKAQLRVRTLLAAKVACQQLRSAVESGLQVTQDAAVFHARTRNRRRGGGFFETAHHSAQVESAESRIADGIARLDACLERARVDGWEHGHHGEADSGLVALLTEVIGTPLLWGAREQHTQLLELSGRIELLDDLLDRRIAEAGEES
ncbi:MAG: hypothetical protein H6737_21565 [Alphaproteobacteria bacterium]|nr:hypothetical protein [Alphaproteobacteria bacterium]